MRQLREMLRLKQEVGLTHRAIADACGVASSTVSLYLERAATAGLAWPVPADLDDAALEARLFTRAFRSPGTVRPIPDAAGRHAAAALERVPRHVSGRLQLQPILRLLSSVAADAEAVDAAGPPGGREGVS